MLLTEWTYSYIHLVKLVTVADTFVAYFDTIRRRVVQIQAINNTKPEKNKGSLSEERE